MKKESRKILVVSFQSLTAESGSGMAKLGYFLSDELHKRGLLMDFIVYSKGKYQTSFPSRPVSFLSRYLLFALNKFNRYVSIKPYKFRLLQEYLYDWLCTFRIDASIDTLFVTNPFLKRTFKKAKKYGIKIIFTPANAEENTINRLVKEETQRLQLEGSIDAYTYNKRLRYFNNSIHYVDKIIAINPVVYKSYKESNFKGSVIHLPIHLKPDFKPVVIEDRADTGTFNVGYLAHTVILKGLQYLLQAWEQLMQDTGNDTLHLYIGGGIDADLKTYLQQHYGHLANVHYQGPITDVAAFMKDKDIFVIPSLTDAAPYTALEAAHYAVPVIITENCGAAELLSRGDSGCWLIPIRDAAAIKERILWAYQHQEAASQVGINAKHNLDAYNMKDFILSLADYLETVDINK